MASWRTNEEMAMLAHEMGELILQAFENEGKGLPYTPGPNPEQTVVSSLVYDAMDFMSLDPHKITEEFLRMQRAAFDTSQNGDAIGSLRLASGRIVSSWHGDAAEAFVVQMSDIELFMAQQERHLLRAAQAMGTLFGLSARIRESYCNLAENITAACKAIIAKQTHQDSSAMIATGIEIVKSGTDLLRVDKIGDLKDWAIDKFFELMSNAAEKEPIDDSGASQVTDSYVRARDQLRRSFEDGLNQLRDWLNEQDGAYMQEPVDLWEPLPSCTDVGSPDFSYERFWNHRHDTSTYTPRVEEERKKYVEEKQQSNGVIGKRLDGVE